VDLPGPTQRKVTCSRCGQVVRDGREAVRDGNYFCKPCAENTYFSNPKEITWAGMNWTPDVVPGLSAPHDHGHHFEKPGKRRAEVIALR
jgi:predicted  nucleic acid-binding Zn-ribbon protein